MRVVSLHFVCLRYVWTLRETQRYLCFLFFFLMIRRPPRSTLDRSSAASDVYKRQADALARGGGAARRATPGLRKPHRRSTGLAVGTGPVSYTHLRAHETVLDLVCRLLLEKKKVNISTTSNWTTIHTVTDCSTYHDRNRRR